MLNRQLCVMVSTGLKITVQNYGLFKYYAITLGGKSGGKAKVLQFISIHRGGWKWLSITILHLDMVCFSYILGLNELYCVKLLQF